jgi:integrase
MPSIERRQRSGKPVWRAHYRTPTGLQRNKTFNRKVHAERFLATIEAAKVAGTYVDPALARITLGEWAEIWLTAQAHLKATTRERYAGILREHIVPAWGTVQLANISHADVQAWVSELATPPRAPATVRKIHRVLSLILDLAVRDGRLSRNVAEKINLPHPVQVEQRYLTIEQVEQLANECGYPSTFSKHRPYAERDCEAYRLVVLFLAYTGVRFGEMAALKVGRLDLPRRRAVIAESVTVVQGKGFVWSAPKTHTRREVPLPDFLAEQLAPLVEGKAPDMLLFPSVRSGGPIRATHFRRGHFDAAAKAIGLSGLHPHELRHTAASLAIASGADVKVVQQMLGHSSATMTLDTYGHLFDDRLDEVSSALDRARKSVELPARRLTGRGFQTVAARPPQPPRPRRAVAQTLPNGDSASYSARATKRKRPGQAGFSSGAPGRIRTFAPASGGRCSIP